MQVEHNRIVRLFRSLYDSYGAQGWWPLLDEQGELHYHPGDHSPPETREQRFEIITGALLTQNTSWSQVEKSLKALFALDALTPENLLLVSESTLKEAIKYSGYYNQKAQRLQGLARWFIQSDADEIPTREELLSLKGVGQETADSILLYAYKQPSFVVDSYTIRVMAGLGFCERTIKYAELKELFESNLPSDTSMFQEFHALLVEHAKQYYSKPLSPEDPLLRENI